jgi:hypothetical protein
MSLIHTCELNDVNPFDYLTELQRYAEELGSKPADWMPWNYRNTLERGVASGEAPGWARCVWICAPFQEIRAFNRRLALHVCALCEGYLLSKQKEC